jgi:hypothetical protein
MFTLEECLSPRYVNPRYYIASCFAVGTSLLHHSANTSRNLNISPRFVLPLEAESRMLIHLAEPMPKDCMGRFKNPNPMLKYFSTFL